MDARFEGKCAIVTGAGSGIGFSIAKELLDLGANVVINDLDAELLAEAIDRLRAGSRCISVSGDAGSLSIITKMIASCVSEFGRLDFAIANAGITSYGAFQDFSEEAFDKLVSLNLKGSYFLAQKSVQQMINQGSSGRIILMSSVTGILSHPYLAAYGMTKAAISNLAKNLVLELAGTAITVNAIAPGAVATERTMAMDVNYDKTWSTFIPSGRVSQPSDIARAVTFLLDDRSEQITGQTLTVDGGITTLCAIPPDTDKPDS